jgi:type I restriction enzyme S subunit
MATNQGFKSFVPIANRLDAHFLLHWLRLRRSHLEGLGTGATFKEVSKAVVARIPIALPPLALQRQFAAQSGAVEALRQECRNALMWVDNLFASLQHRAFRAEL